MTSTRIDIFANSDAGSVPTPADQDFELQISEEDGARRCYLACKHDDPFEFFLQHPLRILSGCRLSSQLGAHIEPSMLRIMKSVKMAMVRLDAEEVREELDELLRGPHVHDALMECVDVLVAVLPELAACRGFAQPTPYHIYDVWEHTAWVVQHSPATSLSRWAALLHDIGKPAAGFMDGDVIHFYGHPLLSFELACSILNRLCMDDDLATNVLSLVKMHDWKIQATRDDVLKTLRRLGNDAEVFRALCKLKRADALAQSDLAKPRLQLAADLERILDEMLEDVCAADGPAEDEQLSSDRP